MSIPFLRMSRRLYKQNNKNHPILHNSTLLIQLYLYRTYLTLPHLSNLTSIIPFHPIRSTLPHPPHFEQSTSTPLYIIQHKTQTKNTNENKITPTLSATSSWYTDCSSDGDGDIHPSHSNTLIPFNHTRPTISKLSNSISFKKARTSSSTTTARYTDCSGDSDDGIVIYTQWTLQMVIV